VGLGTGNGGQGLRQKKVKGVISTGTKILSRKEIPVQKNRGKGFIKTSSYRYEEIREHGEKVYLSLWEKTCGIPMLGCF